MTSSLSPPFAGQVHIKEEAACPGHDLSIEALINTIVLRGVGQYGRTLRRIVY
jgi:hypothetical protein